MQVDTYPSDPSPDASRFYFEWMPANASYWGYQPWWKWTARTKMIGGVGVDHLTNTLVAVHVPFWLICLLPGAPFAFKWLSPARRRARRVARGRCAWCNFDRAGLHFAALCPECGRAGPDAAARTS